MGANLTTVDGHIEAIKQRLGHSSIRVTSDVYGSLIPAVDDALTGRFDARFRIACGENVVNEPEISASPEPG